MFESHQWLHLIIGDFPGLIPLDMLPSAILIGAGVGLALLAGAFILVWAAMSGMARLD
ncbi:MAG: hypothetical protein V3R87_11615 [Dehalococcoidia bacterium]